MRWAGVSVSAGAGAGTAAAEDATAVGAVGASDPPAAVVGPGVTDVTGVLDGGAGGIGAVQPKSKLAATTRSTNEGMLTNRNRGSSRKRVGPFPN